MQQPNEGWGRAWELARDWIEAPGKNQTAWLVDKCADDKNLLCEVRDLIHSAELAENAGEAADEMPALVGQELGPYLIEALIGSGGMGHVWRARHTELGKTVALKVLSMPFPDEQARLRFEHEARIQAQLDHPNIARIHHSGVWSSLDGQKLPWFSMDLVTNARDITEWRSESKVDVREVLKLFAIVCDAVGEAHERGVIHRDIKPNNVLVDGTGRPVVIDFGIAHSTGKADLTRTGSVPGTPRYLAPERLRADDRGSTRSDVYALGLILYELLAGEPRYRISEGYAGVAELRAEQEHPCPKLSGKVAGVIPEIDWILAKAISHNDSDRYANASTLAQDIRNARAFKPVSARRPGVILRARRWIQRRPLVASLAMLAILSAGLGGKLWLEEGRRMHLEEGARRDRASAQASLQLLSGALRKASPAETPGGLKIWSDFLDGAENELRTGTFAPEFEAEFFRLIGQIRLSLGEFDRALTLANSSVEAIGKAPVSVEHDGHQDRLRQSIALLHTGRFDEVIPLLNSLIEDIKAAHPAGSSILFDALANLASAHAELGQTDLARTAYEKLLASLESGEGIADSEAKLIDIRSNLGIVLATKGQFEESLEHLQEVLEWRTDNLGSGHPDTIESLRNFGSVQAQMGRLSEAREALELATTSAESVLGPDHLITGISHAQLGTLLINLGQLEDAERHLRTALRIKHATFPEGHPSILTSEFELGRLAWLRGNCEEALAYLEPVLAQRRATLPPGARALLETLGQTGLVHRQLGHLDEAEALVGEAAARMRDTIGMSSSRTQTMVINLAVILMDQGQIDSCELQLLDVLDATVSKSDQHQYALDMLAQVYAERGDVDSAIKLQKALYERTIRSTSAAASLRVTRRNNFATSLFRAGQFERAEALFQESVYEGEGHIGKEADGTIASLTNLARTLAAMGRIEEAVELAREVLPRTTHHARFRGLLEELLRDHDE